MSKITVSNLNYVSPNELASMILSSPSKIAIIDVRDSDHIGGNITGSTWIPLHSLDLHMPELLRVHSDKDKIVFHCMLSQQRGPGAAVRYKRALVEKKRKEERSRNGVESKKGVETEVKEGEKEEEGEEEDVITQPEVCVLQGGFGSWAPKYGKDERLTTDFVPDLWEDGGMI